MTAIARVEWEWLFIGCSSCFTQISRTESPRAASFVSHLRNGGTLFESVRISEFGGSRGNVTNLCTVRENEPTNLPHGALHLLTRFASVLYPVPSYASIWISASRAVALIRQEAVRAAVPFYASIRCHFMFQVTMRRVENCARRCASVDRSITGDASSPVHGADSPMGKA